PCLQGAGGAGRDPDRRAQGHFRPRRRGRGGCPPESRECRTDAAADHRRAGIRRFRARRDRRAFRPRAGYRAEKGGTAMTEWIDFIVYGTLIAALFFVQPRAGRRLTVPVLADRNPQWVAENPETVRKIERSQWFLWVLHAVGAGGIALLAGVQLGLLDLAPGPLPDGSAVQKWMTLWDINVGFILLAILLGGGAGLYFWFGIYRRI